MSQKHDEVSMAINCITGSLFQPLFQEETFAMYVDSFFSVNLHILYSCGNGSEIHSTKNMLQFAMDKIFFMMPNFNELGNRYQIKNNLAIDLALSVGLLGSLYLHGDLVLA